MTGKAPSERGFGKLPTIIFLAVVVAVVSLLIFFSPLPRFVRESLMQRATSAHYEILCPRGALSQDAMEDFASRQELSFASMSKKLAGVASDVKIRVVFDNEFFRYWPDDRGPGILYSVSGRTIHATLEGKNPQLPGAADAQALLYAAWGKPGNAQLARWTAIWLVGEWRGTEIGMAAAEVEQRLAHKRVEVLLKNPGSEIASTNDQDLLGAAWISEIAEFGGADSVHKLYTAKMAHPNVAEVAQALDTTPLELDRKWQLWMYAYLAGMPSMPQSSSMPMNMPMAGSH